MRGESLVCLLLVIVLSGVLFFSAVALGSGLANTAWPKHQYDQQNTGRSPYAGPDEPYIKWTYTPAVGDKIYYGSIAIGKSGIIYVVTRDRGKLVALNSIDGTEIWVIEVGETWSSPVLSADGTIYLPTRNSVVAVDSKDGTIKWRFTDMAKPTDRLTVNIGNDGSIYFGADDGYLYALNPNGSLQWKTKVSTKPIKDTPGIGHDGTIYVGGDDFKLFAVAPDGNLKWAFVAGGFIHSAPTIDADGTIYFGCKDSSLYAINPDGTLKWKFATSAMILVSSPAIGPDGTIYIGSTDRNLYAVNPDGTLKWTFFTGNRIFSSPAVDNNGVVYIGTIDPGAKLYAVNPDGSKKWDLDIAADIHNCPAIAANGVLYIGNYLRGTLYAIGHALYEYFEEALVLPNPFVNGDDVRIAYYLEEGR